MIVGIFTNLQDKGGVQRVSQHVARALKELAENDNCPHYFISLRDTEGLRNVAVGDKKFRVRGTGMNKGKFIFWAMRNAMNADIVVLGHPSLAPLAIALRVLNPGVRIITWTYGIEIWTPLGLLARRGLQSSDIVVAISNHSREKLIETQGVEASRIRILPPALDPSFLDSAARESRLTTTPEDPIGTTLLSVCRLAETERAKGVDTVIAALARVREAAPNTTYWIVGDGDDSSRLMGVAKDHGVDGNVRFFGRVPEERLRACYKGADIFVLPSKKEGFGIVFVEAMAFGLPVIGGAHHGTIDVVEDGEQGFLVQHGDVDTLARRIQSLVKNSKLRDKMGESGRRRVEDLYTYAAFEERLHEIVRT